MAWSTCRICCDMASCPRFQSRFVLFGDRKSYTGHGPCLYLRPSTNLRKISGVIDDLPQTCRPEYAKQREYFYDAEGMRRNLRDVIENGEQEFDALKVDLYDGICDTCASDYADGLLRMRATLSQAAGFPLSGSVIAQFPSMIKAAEKKGLCHMLVNDHMLEWVHENE